MDYFDRRVRSLVNLLFLNYLNSFEFSLRKPGFSRNNWVGHLFYKNEGLLLVMSTSLVILFSYGLVYFVKLLFSKSLIVKNESNYIRKQILNFIKLRMYLIIHFFCILKCNLYSLVDTYFYHFANGQQTQDNF